MLNFGRSIDDCNVATIENEGTVFLGFIYVSRKEAKRERLQINLKS